MPSMARKGFNTERTELCVPRVESFWTHGARRALISEASRARGAAHFLPFKSWTVARIVFQLRVVAGTPNSLSICPR